MQAGDKIRCSGTDNCIETMEELAKCRIETDFDYTDGLKLVVTKICAKTEDFKDED